MTVPNDPNTRTALAPVRDEICRFLRLMHIGDHQLVAIKPDGGRPIARWFPAAGVDKAADWAVAVNRQGSNLYWSVNVVKERLGKRACKEDITVARFCHADIDPPKDSAPFDKQAMAARLKALPCPPDLIIDSGGGLQSFWRLEPAREPDAHDQVEAINRAIEQALDADHCHNIERVMRLPGTVNWPDELKRSRGRVPAMATLLHVAKDGGYTLERMAAAFPPDASRAPAATADKIVLDWPNVDGELTPDDLGRNYVPGTAARAAIEAPSGKDRSAAGFKAACLMVERGATNEQIAGILLNPANRVSAHYRDPTKHADWDMQVRAVERVIGAARKAVAGSGALVLPAAGGGDDGDRLIRNAKGFPTWCAENASLMLEHHEDWAGALAYDEFHCRTMLLKPVPGAKTARTAFRERELRDDDVTDALRWFNRHGYPMATRSVLHDVMLAVARQAIISPVRHYLEDLRWDGGLRLDSWLVDHCGAEDTAYTRAIGRMWMISAVARALRPGCKADYCMILEGAQGIGKSTLLRTLASDDWFHDALRDLSSKDASTALRGRWIIELPELSAVKRSDVEAVKAFLSRNEERYRPPYGRSEVSEPRRCVFAGTTNRTDYLLDDTGARRFWPMKVARADIEAIARDRDQLWAEAVAAFNAGEPWWPSDKMAREAAQITATRTEDDPWTGSILKYVEGRGAIGTAELLTAVGIHITAQTKTDAKRVGGILRRNGWVAGGLFSSGPYKGSTRYVPGPEKHRELAGQLRKIVGDGDKS